jgi:hypothetical protein
MIDGSQVLTAGMKVTRIRMITLQMMNGKACQGIENTAGPSARQVVFSFQPPMNDGLISVLWKSFLLYSNNSACQEKKM